MQLRVDGHVHLHPCFELVKALTHLAESLCTDGRHGVALLTEREGEVLLRGWIANGLPAGVRGEVCGDGVSVRVSVGTLPELVLVPGRQLVTTDGLEVLALCADLESPARMGFEETVAWATGQGALVVIPWGFGKWTGRRGSLVERLLLDAAGGVLVGDSTMRPNGCPGGRLLEEAAASGCRVLAGSDALPVRGEERFGGRYYVEGAHVGELRKPVEELRERLGRGEPMALGGTRPGWVGVLHRQIRYEWARRLGR
jgi:hypothetical protein